MRNYQKILLDALQKNHWSLEGTRRPEHWWAADIWVIASTRQQFGLRFIVTFIVDPGSDRSNDMAAVREIAMTREPLADYQAVEAIISLRPHSRNYPMDIQAAMTRLDEFGDQVSESA